MDAQCQVWSVVGAFSGGLYAADELSRLPYLSRYGINQPIFAACVCAYMAQSERLIDHKPHITAFLRHSVISTYD